MSIAIIKIDKRNNWVQCIPKLEYDILMPKLIQNSLNFVTEKTTAVSDEYPLTY